MNDTIANPGAGTLRLPSLVRTNYVVRTGSFAFCFFVVGLHVIERGFGTIGWAMLVLQFLIYPHLTFLRTHYAKDPRRAELSNLFVDAVMLGAWAAFLQFPVWITYGLLFGTSMNAVVNRGVPALLYSLGYFGLGAALAFPLAPLGFAPETSPLVTALCVGGSLVYTCSVGFVLHIKARHLAKARDKLSESEQHYRMLAEHAGDLVAMIDAEGRWLYTSPSYERLLAAADLAIGGDAFAKVHPDDADRARSAIVRSATNGQARSLKMRLVDRDGRVRQLDVRAQAIEEGASARGPRAARIVLVSRDVTDLRESEERLLLAAHALEGMAEAIQITAADGTIVTVNKAFSEITGYSRDEALGRLEAEFHNALQPPSFYDELYATVLRKGYWSGTTWSRRKNGAVYREWRSVRAVRDPSGKITHFVAVFYEVGAQRSSLESSTA